MESNDILTNDPVGAIDHHPFSLGNLIAEGDAFPQYPGPQLEHQLFLPVDPEPLNTFIPDPDLFDVRSRLHPVFLLDRPPLSTDDQIDAGIEISIDHLPLRPGPGDPLRRIAADEIIDLPLFLLKALHHDIFIHAGKRHPHIFHRHISAP